MASDRFEHVIGDAHFRQLSDYSVTEIVKPQAEQLRRVAQCAPRRVPFPRLQSPTVDDIFAGKRVDFPATDELRRTMTLPGHAEQFE